MGADEVHLDRFVGLAAFSAASASIRVCSGSRSRKMPDSVITTSMRGRPSSSSGIRSAPAEPAEAVEARLRPHQRQRLADRAAVGLDVVRPPEHQRHGARQRGWVRAKVAPVSRRRGRRIRSACGTGRRRGCCGPWAEPRASGSGRRPAPVRCSAPRARASAPVSSVCWRRSSLDPGAGLGIGLGHDAQVLLRSPRPSAAHDVQPVGDQRILGLQQRQPQLVGVAPSRSTASACSAISVRGRSRSAASGAARASASGCPSTPPDPCRARGRQRRRQVRDRHRADRRLASVASDGLLEA
jgi:hypothetical protein